MNRFQALEANYQLLDEEALLSIQGGDIFSSVGGFVSSSWNTLYNSGRDFGRSLVNALIP